MIVKYIRDKRPFLDENLAQDFTPGEGDIKAVLRSQVRFINSEDDISFRCMACECPLYKPIREGSSCRRMLCQACFIELGGIEDCLICQGSEEGGHCQLRDCDDQMHKQLEATALECTLATCKCPIKKLRYKTFLESHLRYHMTESKQQPCPLFCGQLLSATALDEHANSCPNNLAECPKCKATLIVEPETGEAQSDNQVLVMQLEDQVSTLKAKFNTVDEENKKLNRTIDDLRRELAQRPSGHVERKMPFKSFHPSHQMSEKEAMELLFRKCSRDVLYRTKQLWEQLGSIEQEILSRSGRVQNGQRWTYELKYNDGTYMGYIGEDGKPQGVGRFNNGGKYQEGQWENGNMEGFGRVIYNNSMYYTGMWANGKWHGHGEQVRLFKGEVESRKTGEFVRGDPPYSYGKKRTKKQARIPETSGCNSDYGSDEFW